jgi:hypothetical protein
VGYPDCCRDLRSLLGRAGSLCSDALRIDRRMVMKTLKTLLGGLLVLAIIPAMTNSAMSDGGRWLGVALLVAGLTLLYVILPPKKN